MEENWVIYGVKGSRKVEKAEAGDLLMVFAVMRWSCKERRVVSVEWYLVDADWLGLYRELDERCSFRRDLREEITNIREIDTFKSKLKTYLFTMVITNI